MHLPRFYSDTGGAETCMNRPALPFPIQLALFFLLLALALYVGTLLGKGKQKRQLVERRRSSESSAFLTTAALTALPVFLRSPMIVKLGLPAAAIAALAIMRENTRDK